MGEWVTAIEARVLRFVRSRDGVTSTEVAEVLWPDSESWTRPHGRGAIALARNAARVLHRLARSGVWVELHREGGRNVWKAAPPLRRGPPEGGDE